MEPQIKIVPSVLMEQVVNTSQDVILSITIGSAQIGGNRIEDSKGNIIANGRITKLNLGNGDVLKGSFIIVHTNIIDVNDADSTHRVVTTHKFSNLPKSYKYEDNAPSAGDIVKFQVTYKFI